MSGVENRLAFVTKLLRHGRQDDDSLSPLEILSARSASEILAMVVRAAVQ